MLKIPENFKRFIRIVDFGLIAIHESSDQTHSSDKGNVKYAAPKVLNGRKYNTKADIYNLGILLDQLLDFNMNE
jgi:serine/threonine protein kinase